MKMKIDSGIPTSSPVTRVSETPGRTGPVARSSGGTASGDSVEITSLSARLNQLEGVLAGVPVVDSAQVQAIKDAISSGRFQVNSEVVADRLLSSVKELVLQRGSSA
jgi:negative regulator of flagellin synthesis FlgM